MSDTFDYHVYLDNLFHFLEVEQESFPMLILPIYIDGATLCDVARGALKIYDLLDHHDVITGFSPRMIGTKPIVTGDILQIFSTVPSVTWHIQERSWVSKAIYKLSELARVRKFCDLRLEANACVYYAMDDTILTVMTFPHVIASGAGSKFAIEMPTPLISIKIEEK